MGLCSNTFGQSDEANGPPLATLSYSVDGRDVITAVGGDWDRFAAENGACLTTDRIVGQSLWGHITDRGTREVFGLVLLAVRESGLRLSFPYRCDSPSAQRSMRMTIRPAPDEGVEFLSDVLEVRPLEVSFELAGAGAYNIKNVNICGHCRKVRTTTGWHEVTAAIQNGELTAKYNHFMPIYRTCPVCKDDLYKRSLTLLRASERSVGRFHEIMARYREAYLY